MEYGLDYYDLATFYRERREPAQALEVAREGLQKATGKMDELKAFVADTALRAPYGDWARFPPPLVTAGRSKPREASGRRTR